MTSTYSRAEIEEAFRHYFLTGPVLEDWATWSLLFSDDAVYFDHFYGMDELLEKIESVTAEELQALANEFFHTDSVAVTVLGNLNGLKLTRDQLAC